MCLAVPGRVVAWLDRDPLLGRALVEFGGVRQEVSMACVDGVEAGDYVLVHAGVAIAVVQADEAERTLELLDSIDAG